jgi:hypothetical protein
MEEERSLYKLDIKDNKSRYLPSTTHLYTQGLKQWKRFAKEGDVDMPLTKNVKMHTTVYLVPEYPEPGEPLPVFMRSEPLEITWSTADGLYTNFFARLHDALVKMRFPHRLVAVIKISNGKPGVYISPLSAQTPDDALTDCFAVYTEEVDTAVFVPVHYTPTENPDDDLRFVVPWHTAAYSTFLSDVMSNIKRVTRRDPYPLYLIDDTGRQLLDGDTMPPAGTVTVRTVAALDAHPIACSDFVLHTVRGVDMTWEPIRRGLINSHNFEATPACKLDLISEDTYGDCVYISLGQGLVSLADAYGSTSDAMAVVVSNIKKDYTYLRHFMVANKTDAYFYADILKTQKMLQFAHKDHLNNLLSRVFWEFFAPMISFVATDDKAYPVSWIIWEYLVNLLISHLELGRDSTKLDWLRKLEFTSHFHTPSKHKRGVSQPPDFTVEIVFVLPALFRFLRYLQSSKEWHANTFEQEWFSNLFSVGVLAFDENASHLIDHDPTWIMQAEQIQPRQFYITVMNTRNHMEVAGAMNRRFNKVMPCFAQTDVPGWIAARVVEMGGGDLYAKPQRVHQLLPGDQNRGTVAIPPAGLKAYANTFVEHPRKANPMMGAAGVPFDFLEVLSVDAGEFPRAKWKNMRKHDP